jgi:ATP-dependent DNA helicase RecG
MQRARLREKGTHPDVLVMTATPIPRSLAMTMYGDLDTSIIDELPANRKPVRTAIRTEQQKPRVYEFIKEEVRNGRQAYIVFPLIEESEKLDLKAATTEFERLQQEVFAGFRIGLLHGKMKNPEKDDTMNRFKSGALQILVSTTVIEVGVDVPNATIMLIENAERFGLAQLHQLRGRVGRGGSQSYCILIANYAWFTNHAGTKKDISDVREEKETAQQRLETMVATSDGFKIAETDLRLRGPGEFFGTRQSGLPELRLASLVADADLVVATRRAAASLLHTDPHLRLPDHACIRDYFELEYRALLDLGSIG